MATLTKVQQFSGTSTGYIDFGALSGAFPSNVAHTWAAYFYQETAAQSGYLVAKALSDGSGARLFADAAGSVIRYGLRSTGGLTPSVPSAASTIPLGQWHFAAGVYDGAGVAVSDLKIFVGANGGSVAEVSYQTGSAGSGSINSDSASSLLIGNRVTGLDRGFKGRIAYIAHFNKAMTAAELQAAFTNGPMSDPACDFLWANGADLVGGKTPSATGAGVSDDTSNLPPNTELGGAAPFQAAAVATVAASATLTTGIALESAAVGTGSATATLVDGSFAAAAVASAVAQATLTTGIQLQANATSTSISTAALASSTTTLDADFAGANANLSLSSITGANTDTPTVVIRVRSPEDTEWQQWLFKLNGVRGKTITVQVLLTEKEMDPDAYLGTWVGPCWSTNNAAAPSGWTHTSWSQVSGDRMTFTVAPGAVDSIYLASMPPWTQDSVAAWIAELETNYSSLIHDDLPSRVALGDSAYVCARSGTGTDENGRQISNLPLYGFRIGNDAIGVQPKRRVVLMAGVHSGEWNGGLQLRGFVRELLTGVHSTALLTRFDFYVYPLHSVKGNYLGFRRNEASATYSSHKDANREWADGDTSSATVVQWQGILDADHGVAHANKVVAFFDFHDSQNSGDPTAHFYYFTGQTGYNEFLTIVSGQNSTITTASSSIPDGTTSQYWMAKGLNFAWTCEAADEKSTIAEYEDYGEAYARSLKLADDAGQVPNPQPWACNARSTGTAAATLNTGVVLQCGASAGAAAVASLTTNLQLQAAAFGNCIAAVNLTAGPAGFASDARASASAQAVLTTAIQMQANAVASTQASTTLGNVVVYAPARESGGRSYAVPPNEPKRPVIPERKRYA